RIAEQLARPARLLVAGIHAEPDGEHADVALGARREHFRLRPPGALQTGGSGRRQQEDHPGMPLVGVEPGFDLVDSAELTERSPLRRARLRREQTRRRQQYSARTNRTPPTPAPPI